MEGRGGVVQGKHQSYTLSAASEDERDSWVHAIRSEPRRPPSHAHQNRIRTDPNTTSLPKPLKVYYWREDET